ncbi:GntR family transcriptional regulator [Streptomyces sp. NPDC053541]|uniref:GntR family transcriptional regulator n=1 Tax=Streptomyces sp. NPDC053541 TaxID=3365709 RepID=UPI0037D23810
MAGKWKALADRLEREINEGVHPPGAPLPQILDQVAAGAGSKATVSRAYQELEAKGLVTSRRGHGTVVRDRSRVRVPLNRYERVLSPGGSRGPWETATADQGLDGRMEVATPAAETLEAPADIARLLGLDPGTEAVRRQRRAMIGSDVIALQDAWYPLDVAQAAGLDRPDKITGGVLGALVGAGLVPAEADEYVTAEEPTPQQAAQLAIGVRVAVLVVDRVTRDRTGRVIELVRVTGAADRLQLVYSPLPLRVRTPRSSRPQSPTDQ